MIGVHDRRLHARKCYVQKIDSKTSKDFLDENHIQGAVNAKISLGLFSGAELVSVMTFSKPRFSKKCEWELLRFCNKCGCHIPGAASKLLSRFEKLARPHSILSYADRRWSQGKLYYALGFGLDHASKPDYWYFDTNDHILRSRLAFQKHKLKSLLEHYDPDISEVENMKANGYHRIFDCGNLVFAKVYAS